ncbi:RNA-directed DNA polymerase (Reverse transcriptase), Ribonuclease H [Gossypium australe]|uniref:RNA-directed DNA polymerase (Reverse transcriptase), Ribonuclease H n=1 Tax=Gossypium australe TaxID=47621 RepID=A0A5B6V3F1_9ROSI|nr:RNA-directed DNA polymerase (Reverse transcriptase), Ribonuclease H [Gossypium australe]
MNDAATDSESTFEQDMSLEGSQDFEDDRNCNPSPDLLRMVEQDEKQILPYKKSLQIMRFGYCWSTMEGDCISYTKKCHKCQFYGDKIPVPPSSLHKFAVCSRFKTPYFPRMNGAMEAKKSTFTGAMLFSLIYGIEAVLPIEVEIPSIRILSELKLDEAK